MTWKVKTEVTNPEVLEGLPPGTYKAIVTEATTEDAVSALDTSPEFPVLVIKYEVQP